MGTKASKTKIDRTSADEPVVKRRLKVLSVLKKMGATSSSTARPGSLLSAKTGYTPYDVYCLLYSKYFLGQNGYVQQLKQENEREVHYFITAKGQKFLAAGGETKVDTKTSKKSTKKPAKVKRETASVNHELELASV